MNRWLLGPASGLLCDPAEGASLDYSIIRWFANEGVGIDTIASPIAVRAARVTFDLGSGYQPCPGIGTFALIIPIAADPGTIVTDLAAIDMVAWSPSSGRIGTRRGQVFGLGADQIDVDGHGTTGLPIPVHRDPLGWLQAGRRGIVIVDWEMAAFDLRGLILEAEDETHRRDLVRRLTPRPPTVVVAQRRVAA